MTNSITLHQNMGSHQQWDNPNVYPGDINGNPITPKKGETVYLWAVPQNNGTAVDQDIVVSFYICIPSPNPVWPPSSHGSNFYPSIAPSAQQPIMCSVPWIPDTTAGSHQCIAAVVSCLDCPVPPTIPGQEVDYTQSQIGLHNVSIQTVATTEAYKRPFTIHKSANAGYVEMTREPLASNATLLKGRGIDPKLEEAPVGEGMKMTDQDSGKELGTKFHYDAGQSFNILSQVDPKQIKSGTGALYHVRQYENGKLIGGVSQILLHG